METHSYKSMFYNEVRIKKKTKQKKTNHQVIQLGLYNIDKIEKGKTNNFVVIRSIKLRRNAKK